MHRIPPRCTPLRTLPGVAAPSALVLLLIPALPRPALARNTTGYEYVSPIPDSRWVSPWNNIVIRPGARLTLSSLDASALSVVGSMSGRHTGSLVMSDDGRTLIFNPGQPFALGERVRVRFGAPVARRDGAALPPLEFAFDVSDADPRQTPRDPRWLEPELRGMQASARGARSLASPTGVLANVCGPLPRDYPTISITGGDHPDPGNVFLAPFGAAPAIGRLVIIDDNAQPLFYRRLPSTAYDFKRQPNGLLTYYSGTKFYGLDSSYAVVDSFMMGNGYGTDVHDLQLLPNGHALLMAYNNQFVNMDSIVPGGQPHALVAGLIVQEIDQAKNVVFQWRSWDCYQITDADPCLIDLRGSYVDYVHGNAVELDTDGNLLISARAMNEITKINRATGDFIWRLGLKASNNEFTFPNDTRGWSAQHDIRRLPNGHITLFDNGNCLSPIYSRALEYQLDEVHKVATLVWQYGTNPTTYTGFMGNVQRHADGGTTIGWGGTGAISELSDLHADGSLGLRLSIGFSNMWSYRAFRFPWSTSMFAVAPDTVDFGTVAYGAEGTQSVTVRNRTNQPLTITCVTASDPSFTVLTTLPLTIDPAGSSDIALHATGTAVGQQVATLYVRTSNDTSLVAQSVGVKYMGVASAPSVTPVGAGLLATGLLAGAAVVVWRRREPVVSRR